MPFLVPTKAWTMCSSDEAFDRASFKELSPFECTPMTYKLSPKDRVPDPMKCVKKYRRNAAGGGVESKNNPCKNDWKRSLHDLLLSTDYLLGTIFARQQNDSMQEKESLVKTVNFVDDRLRAIQVDLTTLMGSMSEVDGCNLGMVREIQMKIIRYHILTRYLLSSLDSNDKYEWKFADTALTTAITCFLAAFHNKKRNEEEDNILDEVLSYASLLHIAAIVKRNELALPQTSVTGQRCGIALENGEGFSAILGIYRKYTIKSCVGLKCCGELYPKYAFSLKIAVCIDTGDFLSALNYLNPKKQGALISEEERWRILSRCCMAQAIPMIRMGLVRRYNKSFGKQEIVRGEDLSRLLHLPSSSLAVEFCNSIGLPTCATTKELQHDSVMMKSSPISVASEYATSITNPGRSMDQFVFGENKWISCDACSTRKDPYEGLSSLQRALLKLKIQEDPNEINIDDDGDDENNDELTRKDEDGVIIFPASIIRSLIG